MKLTWLGQAGFYLLCKNGTGIMIDPYLSDSLFLANGESHRRQTPLCESFLRARVDVLIITHAHGDHMDFGTIDELVKGNRGLAVLAPEHVFRTVSQRYGSDVDGMLFDPGTEITLHEILFRAVYAMHSDPCPIGAVIEADGLRICHTGDTMYHRRLLEDCPSGTDLLILPINGKGNNMNAVDAARLTRALKPKAVFPMHWDMFASYAGDPAAFAACFAEGEQRILLPPPYQEITL